MELAWPAGPRSSWVKERPFKAAKRSIKRIFLAPAAHAQRHVSLALHPWALGQCGKGCVQSGFTF